MLALTYNDIDLEKRTISINKSYQRLDGRDIITPPKTPKSKRIVTIPPFLAEEFVWIISWSEHRMENAILRKQNRNVAVATYQ